MYLFRFNAIISPLLLMSIALRVLGSFCTLFVDFLLSLCYNMTNSYSFRFHYLQRMFTVTNAEVTSMNFNLKLKIRTFRKMTQKELSEKIGLTDQHRIVQYEKGVRVPKKDLVG